MAKAEAETKAKTEAEVEAKAKAEVKANADQLKIAELEKENTNLQQVCRVFIYYTSTFFAYSGTVLL